MWHDTQNKRYLDTCIARMSGPVLVWVDQFIDILTPFLISKKVSLNDIGCNVGQFYKGLTERGFQIDYRGFDIEQLYLKQAKKFFPKNKNKFNYFDICKQKPATADISITSATLEHLPDLSPALDNILSSTRQVVLIRTWLAENQQKRQMTTIGSSRSYPVNQYSFVEILSLFAKHKFSAQIIRDRYTDSLPKFISSETTPPDEFVRTQYLVLGQR